MVKFCQFKAELSACYRSVFSFPDENLSKYQWTFTSRCITILELCFGLANGQIWSIFDEVICPIHICILVSGQ